MKKVNKCPKTLVCFPARVAPGQRVRGRHETGSPRPEERHLNLYSRGGGDHRCVDTLFVPTCAVRETASLGQHMLERWKKMG